MPCSAHVLPYTQQSCVGSCLLTVCGLSSCAMCPGIAWLAGIDPAHFMLNGRLLDICSVTQLQRGSQTDAAAADPVCCSYTRQHLLSSLLPCVQASYQARRS